MLLFLLGVVLVALIFLIAVQLRQEKRVKCIYQVEPVPEKYDWRFIEPKKYRPMKPVYHMIMNVGKVSPDDWLHIDSDYKWVTESHTRILNGEKDLTCKVNGSSETLKAVQELYELVLDVLIQRYPSYFVKKGYSVYNAIRNVEMPFSASASKLTAEQLLRILMENTEEDFQVLQYDANCDEYVIRAIGGLTSDGFLWQTKLNKKLTDVHAPVPGYAEKLKNSMNKFFNKLQPGSIIQRFTWGIHIGSQDKKFHPIKSYKGSGPNGIVTESDVDFNKEAWLRVERQVPMKLPKTKFLILTQHTYWYPLKELKEEGIGPMTAQSIEAWPQPFADYKGRDQWADAVCNWLRS